MTDVTRKTFLIRFAYTAAVAFTAFFVLRYIFFWILPFLIGFGIAALINPAGIWLEHKTGINKRIWSVSLILLFYIIVIAVLSIFFIKTGVSVQIWLRRLPEWYEVNLQPTVQEIQEWLDTLLRKLAPEYGTGANSSVNGLFNGLGAVISELSGKAINFLTDLAEHLPKFITALFFTILSSVFLCFDYSKIAGFIMKQIPKKPREILFSAKEYLVTSFFKMVRAYLLIMAITFIELSAGLWILRVEQPLLIALVTALLDALPVLGVSIVLVPWILICLLQKNFFLATGLSILFLVVTIVRNLIEPKIVGDQIGLHPLVSLIAFYVGLQWFGVVGMFLLPVVVIVLKNLNDNGKLKLWKQ